MKQATKFIALLAFVGLSLAAFSCQQNAKADTAVKTEVAKDVKPQKLAAEKLDSGARVVYLTFDDGPLPGSEALQKTILEKKFKASVFIVGKHTKNGRNSLRVVSDFMKNPYVDVCNHSYTHANNQYDSFYKNDEAALADFQQNQKELALENKIIRLPGRQLWALPTRDLYMKSSGGKTAERLRQDGYKVYGWDVEWHGKGTAPKETADQLMVEIDNMFQNDRTFTRNNLVVLAHDPMFSKPEGAQELAKLVDLLRAKGYILENIRHYPEKDIM